MDSIQNFTWIILLIIGISAAIKILCVVRKNRTHRSSTRSRTASHIHTNANTAVGSNVTETGPMIYYANNPHGLSDKEYRFTYKQVYDSQFGKKTWRAYITKMPGLRGRDSNLHITHRHTDGNGKYWVCWDSPVETLKDMQSICRVWADSIQEYIATGKRFG